MANNRFVKINKSRGLWRWCSTLQLTHKKQSKNQSKIGGKPGAGIRHGIPRRRTEQNGMANICKDCITRLTLITTSWTSRIFLYYFTGWVVWLVCLENFKSNKKVFLFIIWNKLPNMNWWLKFYSILSHTGLPHYKNTTTLLCFL